MHEFSDLGRALFYLLEKRDPEWLGATDDRGVYISEWADLAAPVKERYIAMAEEFVLRNATQLSEAIRTLTPAGPAT